MAFVIVPATNGVDNMINERIALVMLNGEVISEKNDPHYTKQFYKSMQSFAEVSLELCEQKKFIKLDRYLRVAVKFFREGNETVKNGIINIYLHTLMHTLDKQQWLENFMPEELRKEYVRQLYSSAV